MQKSPSDNRSHLHAAVGNLPAGFGVMACKWRSSPDNSQAPILLHNIPIYKSEQPTVDISGLSSPQPGFSNLPAFLLLLTLLLHLRGCRRTCGSPHVPQTAEICKAARRLLREEIRRGSSSKAFPTWCHGILANKSLQVPNTR